MSPVFGSSRGVVEKQFGAGRRHAFRRPSASSPDFAGAGPGVFGPLNSPTRFSKACAPVGATTAGARTQSAAAAHARPWLLTHRRADPRRRPDASLIARLRTAR